METNGVKAHNDNIDIPEFMKGRNVKLAQRPSEGGDIVDFKTRQHLAKPSTKVSSDGDYYTPSQERTQRRRKSPEQIKKERKAQAAKRKKADARKNFMFGTLAAIALIAGGNKVIDNINSPHANFNAQGHSVVEVADFMGIEPEAIMVANDGIETPEQPVYDIVLPERYSPYGEEIAELEYRIENDKLTQSEREELQAQLEELQTKQSEQEKVATAYIDSDGKFVYLVPTEDNTPVEDIKDAYDIPDEVVKYYNDIDYFWNSDGEGEGYRDYRSARTPEEGIKVPYDKIGADTEE